jgi:lysozyme
MILDLSKWNGTLDAAKMKAAGVQGVILRASYGANRDERVDDYATRLKAAGVPIIGAYHYYHPWEPWRPQLDTLKAVMAKHGLRRGYLDLEDSRVTATMARDAGTFMVALAAEMPLPPGKRHGIYTNVAYWRNMGAPGWGSLYDLWIAAWTDVSAPIVPAPWQRWTLWQWSNSGDGPRYGLQSARVDMNRFNGTPAEYAEWLKVEAIPVDVAALIRADSARVAGWNPEFGFPRAMLADGLHPLPGEYTVTTGDKQYVYQVAQRGDGKRRIYYAPLPWGSGQIVEIDA